MTTRPETLTAGVYCRISTDREHTGLGVERQRQDCLRLAAALGWRVVDTYVDNDVSAYTGRRRPGYERLLQDLASGRIDAVLAWHLDRLNRSPQELERLIGLLDTHRVPVQTVTAGMLDLATPTGRAIARTLGAWARYESEHKSERIRAQKRQAALTGAVNGGANRPYGYGADKRTVIPAEAAIIREAMRRFLAGTPTGRLCREFNARGVPTTGRRRWYSSNLDMLLQSARIAGWRQAPASNRTRTPAEFLVRAQWPGIVSRRAVERARDLMADQTRRPGSSRRWLLSGIALCGGCGQPMAMTCPAAVPARYCCQRSHGPEPRHRCGHVSITAGFLDTLVLTELTTAVHDGLIQRILDHHEDSDAGGAHQAAAPTQPHPVPPPAGTRGLSPNPANHAFVRHPPTPARLAAVHGRLTHLARDPHAFPTAWSAMARREQRELVQLLASSITVAPAPAGTHRALNPERVTIILAG